MKNLAFNTRRNAKHNLHNNRRRNNFSQREVNGEIDKVIKDEMRKMSLLHINNTKFYSNPARSANKPNVNMIDNTSFKTTTATNECTTSEEGFSNDKCIGLTFYAKPTSNLDQFENDVLPKTTCVSLENNIDNRRSFFGSSYNEPFNISSKRLEGGQKGISNSYTIVSWLKISLNIFQIRQSFC